MSRPVRDAGSVLGIDIGFSESRRSSAVCRLDWDGRTVCWRICRFPAVEPERSSVIRKIAGKPRLDAAAFDGPLRQGFDRIGCYRTAERMLTRRLRNRIGKPGQASAPVGVRLNEAANTCALIVKQTCRVAAAVHPCRIDELAIVEAFPTAFLGIMVRAPGTLSVRRSSRSDLFYSHLAQSGQLDELLGTVLPGRAPAKPFTCVTNHDDRAGLVCALTALCVAMHHFTAVGDENGWIILRPRSAIQDWAAADLEKNASEEASQECLHFVNPQSDNVP